MAKPAVEPITDEELPAFCRFLTTHLSDERSSEQWAEAFRQDWGMEKPNHGFLIRVEGQIVGGIGAIYAQRLIDGKPERFCNITSWCVLDQYRSQSMRLAIAVTSQSGFHFTDLTPTEVVSKTLQFLKFKPMNERQALFPHFIWPHNLPTAVRIITHPDQIEKCLLAEDSRAYRDHRHLPWLNHLAVGFPGAYCYLVWRRTRLKGVPGAYILAASSPELFLKYRIALGSHLLLKHGLLFTRVESRLLPEVPKPSIELSGFRNKVFRSETLSESDISNLYTEIVALDL
ncbi:MAG: hypothetical protein KDI83_13955 [Gammaproteobacteria bacterium]|nr:hypothetical protein [Gammaproteobacteria bacterium]